VAGGSWRMAVKDYNLPAKRRNIVKQNQSAPHATFPQRGCNSDTTKFLLSENPYILSGFREYTEGSFMECSKSVFHVHNDTMNIWTHLAGAAWSICAIYDVLFSSTTYNGVFYDKAVFCTFLFFTFMCFLASAAYHVYRSHSVAMYKLFLVFDVGSIAIQIYGSVQLIAYFEMSCHSSLRIKWMLGLAGLFVVSVGSVPYLLRHRLYNIRTLLLTIFALSGFVSHFHRLYLNGMHYTAKDWFIFKHLIMTYVFPGLGLVLRRTKIPELFFPGKFDIWLSSHQIFHVLVIMGPWSVYTGYRPFLVGEGMCVGN
jgi:adiponectin receptor